MKSNRLGLRDRGGERRHNGNTNLYSRLAASVNAAACTLDPENAAAEFAERAAIAEYDGGLSHEEAEALAFRELGIGPLAPQCRIGCVEFFGPDRAWYQPREDGPAFAVIVPVVELGDTVDLAAIDLETQHIATRRGIGKALGLDNIDSVRWNGGMLTLVDKPLDWLREPAAAACLIDWKIAAFTLADLDRPTTTLADQPIAVRCSSLALAERIARAFARPLPAPDLHVRTP